MDKLAAKKDKHIVALTDWLLLSRTRRFWLYTREGGASRLQEGAGARDSWLEREMHRRNIFVLPGGYVTVEYVE